MGSILRRADVIALGYGWTAPR